jgi:hypothetical protein
MKPWWRPGQYKLVKLTQNDYFVFRKITCWGCPNPMGPTVDIHELEKVRKRGFHEGSCCG